MNTKYLRSYRLRSMRTFLHYFTFLNATPPSRPRLLKNYLATLDDQMRGTMLTDPGFTKLNFLWTDGDFWTVLRETMNADARFLEAW